MNKSYLVRNIVIALCLVAIVSLVSKSLLAGLAVGLLPLVIALAWYPRRNRLDNEGRPKFDEREILVHYRAARISWAFLCISLASIILYQDVYIQQNHAPTSALSGILMASIGIYTVLKFVFKRT
ncbi:MAG: hypothetical protein OEZ43_08700 [Gammaproteobacteria bacterium]|nr:hypothetical protein [Gammaproteobacteria bacterium]